MSDNNQQNTNSNPNVDENVVNDLEQHDDDTILNPEDNPMRLSGSKYLSNNATKLIILLLFFAFAILIFALLWDETSKNNAQAPEEIKKASSVGDTMNAEIITKNASGAEGIIPANIQDSGTIEPKTDAPVSTENTTTQTTNRLKPIEPKPELINPHTQLDYNYNQQESEAMIQKRMARAKELETIRQAKIQMFTSSVNANTKTTIKFEKNNSTYTNTNSAPVINGIDTSEGYTYAQNQRDRINSSINNVESFKNQFSNNGSNTSQKNIPFTLTAEEPTASTEDKWTLNAKVQSPKKLALMTGFVIPATLITGINSDLPGQIIAQVSQNVYDSATGRNKLIPQGTKIIGSYDAQIIFGQERVLVMWNRLVFPDGKNIDIGNMNAADQAGYAGASDLVNNHYLKLFGSSLLLSVVSAAATYSQDKYANNGNNNNNTTASGAMAQSFGNQMGQTTIQVIQKHMNVSPTLEIRPGYKINVMVNKDIVFSKPYQNYDY